MFIDHFSDGSVGLIQHPGNGTITEPAGTQLRLYCPENQDCNIATPVSRNVTAYKAAGILGTHRINGPWSFDVKLDNFTTTGNILSIAGILAWQGDLGEGYGYEFGFYANENKILIHTYPGGWSGSRITESPQTKPNGTVKHIYRVFVNPLDKVVKLTDTGFGEGLHWYINPNSIGFAFSVNDGATWTWWHQRTMEFRIDWVGPHIRSWDNVAGQSQEALFDYFSMASYAWDDRKRVYLPSSDSFIDPPHDQVKKTMHLVEDDVVLTRGGGGRADYYSPEIDRGAMLPGANKPGAFEDKAVPTQSVEDDVRFLTLPGDPESSALVPGSVKPGSPGGVPTAAGMEDSYQLRTQKGLEDWFSIPEIKEAFRFKDGVGRQVAGMEDELYWEMEEADYQDEKDDADGNELLYDAGAERSLLVRTDEGGLGNPGANNHWGADRTGQLYADGVACGSEGTDFGTLAGGKKVSAWRFTDGGLMCREPYYNTTPTWYNEVLSDDDELEITISGQPADHIYDITSHGKWYLPPGNFDIEIEFDEFTGTQEQNRFEWGVANSRGGNPAFTGVYMYIRQNTTVGYLAARQIAGAYAELGRVTMSPIPSAGRMRITRTANVFQCYKWDAGDVGWVNVGTTYSHANLEDNLYVWMGYWCDDGDSGHIKIRNFTINSVAGPLVTTASWAREASGDHRGTQAEMPVEMAIVADTNAVNLIDTATDKLWMRFLRGTNYAFIQNSGNSIVRDIAWKDGMLLLAVGRNTAESEEGNVIVIDFTMDIIRYHRESASTVCGAFFQHWQFHEPGHIANRNIGYGWANDNDTWHVQDYRTRTVAVLHDGGYHYRAIGSVEGLNVFKWLRWNMNGAESGVNDDDWGMVRSTATEATEIRKARFWGSELFYLDDTNLYSRDRTNGGSTGWEDTIGATFSAEFTKALPGTRFYDSQYSIWFYQPAATKYVFVPANEGVYRIDWPSGSWELFYGFGGTHDILPPSSRVTSISIGNDGTYDLMVIGLETASESQVFVVKLIDNTVYGISVPKAPTRAPKAVAS